MTDIDSAARLAPVRGTDRIGNLDVLRGWAVLGILAVNAVAFAWPFEVYSAPEIAPFAMAGADKVGTWVTDVFFHDKFRSLFSMLFGVSIFLVGGEREDRDRGALLRRRLMFLALFGVIHGAAIWFGDILLHYAYCGFLMLLMRSWSAKRLLWVGGGVTLLWGLLAFGGALAMANMPPEFAAKMQGGPAAADPAAIATAIERIAASGSFAMLTNLKNWAMLQGFSLFLIPITVPLMMIGLGLFKSGFFSGRAPAWVYVVFIALGAANLAALGWYHWMDLGSPKGTDPSGGLGGAFKAFAPVVTLGYASALILLAGSAGRVLTDRLAPVGRMAFSNYLTQSLIMAGLFYLPGGPRLFGDFGPGMLWAFVVGVWVLQLIWSPLWLSRFEMGPLEWCWRCLTYGRRVPLRKVAAA